MFLRLRHSELGKSFSSYSNEYKEKDDYYHINIDMNDPNIVEPYDGVYELSIVISDPSLDNPIIWSFGKIEVKFTKAKDPAEVTPSYKNFQKTKMEPNYEEEVHDPKYILSFTFCGAILFLTLIYLRYIQKFNVNLSNFPSKDNFWNFLFAALFVVSIIILAYIYVLFWVKINIVQALFACSAIGFFALIFGYQVLTKVKID